MRVRRLDPRLRQLGLACGLGALGIASAFVVAGCGSSSASPAQATTSTSSTTPASSTGTTGADGFAAYRSCLQRHGVTLPQGGFGRRRGAGNGGAAPAGGAGAPAGPTRLTPAQQEARRACASLRPQGGFGGRFDSGNPAFQKFQACLRQHGVQPGMGFDRSSPASRSAFAACRNLLPAGGGFGDRGFGGEGGNGADSQAFARFQACLRQHGVQPGRGGQSSARTQAAIAACRTVLPNGGNGGGTATIPLTTTSGG